MKDINAEFKEIMVRYGIIQDVTLDKAIDCVRKLEQKYQQGKAIGLYGCGVEADELLMFIFKYTNKLKITCCFDKNVRIYQFKDKVINKNVFRTDEIIDKNVECIILGSYRFKDVYIENLNEIGYQGEIIDLYKYLDKYIQESFSDYKIIFDLRQKYLNCGNEEKEVLLQQLIKQYLLLKDFTSAFQYIEDYCKKKYALCSKYLKLKIDLQKMLDGIGEHINARQKKDILWNWVDAISHDELSLFPYLNRKAYEGVHFKKAYTVIPWTTDTKKMTLSGEYPIEGQLFKKENLCKDNMKLLKILSENGYEFGYCGMPRFAKLFDNTVMLPEDYYSNKYFSSLQKQWNALAMLCMSDKPMCILIHTLHETHASFIGGDGDTLIFYDSKDWEQDNCREQAEASGRYIDNRLEFYEQFYGQKAIKVYMSDHGRAGNSPMNEQKIHIILFINGEKIEKQVVEDIFSLVRFPDLIEKIIKGENDWNALTDSFAIIENLDIYNESIVKDALAGKFLEEEMYQCRGIITKKDKYYLYANGKEFYFATIESSENEIDNPEYTERIEELRELCGKEFIDIYQYEKFRFSRLLYNTRGKEK